MPRSSRCRRLVGGVGAVALVAALAACGSSSKSSAKSSASTSSAGSSGKASGAPIKVGVICSCSGAFGANEVPIEDVYKAWANATNAAGGINGHPVQLTTEDDAGSPGTSVSDIQTLISDHVDAIADMSIVDETWASTIKAAGIPVVGVNASETPFYNNSDFYPEGQTNDSSDVALVTTAKSAGASNFGDLYCAESVSCQESVPQLRASGQQLSVPMIYSGEIAATAPNYTAQCVAAHQAHVDALFIGDSGTILGRVGSDCAKQGYKPIFLEQGEGYTPSLNTVDGVKDNLWIEFNDLPFFASSPVMTAMNSAVDKYYPGLRSNVNGWSDLATMSWPSGILLEDAVKAGGLSASATPSPAEIVTGLQSLKGDTLQGTAPPLTFAAGKPHPVDCWFTGRLINGTPSVVNGGKDSCQTGS